MTDSNLTLQSTMEEAIENLQHSICLAQICAKKPVKLVDELLSHRRALEEDMRTLQITQTKTPETLELARQTNKEALWLKRTLEREAITLKAQEPPGANAVDSKASTSTVSTNKKKIKLENLTIPTFTGDATKFKMFFDTFVDNVENNPDLTDTAKWIHLDKSVTGQAAELISKVPRMPETRKIALNMLQTRYGSVDRTICDMYQQLSSLPPATMEDNSLRMTQAQIEGLLLSLEGLGHIVNTNSYIKSVVKGKFPRSILHLVVPTPEADNLQTIRTNLQTVLTARESATSDVVYTTSTSQVRTTPPSASHTRQQKPATTRPLKCIFCGEAHWSDECPRYTTIEARTRQLGSRCTKCFRTAHTGDCMTKRRCNYCDSADHNRALCPTKFPQTTTLYTSAPVIQPASDGVYLTMLLTVTSDQQHEPMQIRAVLDSAGGKTILTSDVAQHLNIQPHTEPIAITGMGKIDLPAICATDNTLFLHPPTAEPIPLAVHITPNIADDLPAADIAAFKHTYPQHQDCDIPPSGAGQKIDLLLGKDSLAAICTLQNSIQVNDQHQLLSTRFGFLIMGHQLKPHARNTPCLLSFTDQNSNDLQQLWQLDTLGLGDLEINKNEQEELAITSFNNNIKFVQNRYEVAWPFIIYPPLLNDDYRLAVGRLRSLWNKLKPNPQLLQAYHTVILDQLEQNVIEAVTETSKQNSQITHYLPHHPIIRNDKTTKLRIVYDASAKSQKNAKSLNENLHTGGNWVCHMLNILIGFRQHQQVVVADIEKAFLQIGIRAEDRDAVRFLWLKDPLKPPTNDNLWVLRFQRMAFGIVSSPFLLAATIKHHLQNHPTEYNQLIQSSLYADNLVVSLPDDVDPIHFYDTVKKSFMQMSMNMTKWSSNIPKLRAHIPPNDQDTEVNQTVLGLQWSQNTDTLTMKPLKYNAIDAQIITKRKALQQMATLFDPLGLVTPVTLLAKKFIRKLWNEQQTWDAQLLTAKQTEWALILQQLNETKTVTLSRQFFPQLPTNDIKERQLHVFTDASAEAYAVVIYACAITNDRIQCTFVAAKSRLTPAKMKSIPRLELLAILVGARFAQFIRNALNWTPTPIQYLWTDSKCAIAWITGSKLLPALLQKQVQEIHKTNVGHIRYVPSEQNFADIATRGASVHDLREMKWWDGPLWLKHPQRWPTQPTIQHEVHHKESTVLFTIEEKRKSILPNELAGIMGINYERYSSYNKLLLIVAYCLHAVNKLCRREILHLAAVPDTNLAEKALIQFEQRQAYPHVYTAATPTKNIKNIRIFIDENDIIRCATRITNAELPYQTVSPILLVRGSRLTNLIIMQTHQKTGHSGTAHTLAEIRKRYWIPQGRREIYNTVRRDCYLCKKYYAKPYCPPPPTPLPEFRVTQVNKPFQTTGLDVLGPFLVRTLNIPNATKSKKWVQLHTCAVTRAVHLEVLSAMNTEEFLEAFRRFVARRGTPSLVVCDNAPQLHSINDNFRKNWESATEEKPAVQYFATNQIQFRFIPPNSPWMGGFYERLVAAIKQSLEKTYGNRCMLARQFQTSIIEIEGILNARPLTYVDAQPGSRIITPQDFLHVQHTAIPLAEIPVQKPNTFLNLWKSSQHCLNEFWKEWRDHFLLYLRERDDQLRQRRGDTTDSPKPGDIVLLTNPDTKRCAWQIGRIETLIKSNDGQVRSALVNLGNNRRLIKPVIKLAPIGLHADVRPQNIPELNAARDAIVVDSTPYTPTSDQIGEEDEVIEIQLDTDW